MDRSGRLDAFTPFRCRTPVICSQHRSEVVQQLAGEALQLEQVDDVLVVHAGRVPVEWSVVSAN